VGKSSTKLKSFFHKAFSIISTLFPPLRKTLYAGRAELLVEASELFKHAVFQLVVAAKKKKVLRVHPSGGQKDGSQIVLNRDCREDGDLIYLPVRPNHSNSLL
jgi:hypothetical protein